MKLIKIILFCLLANTLLAQNYLIPFAAKKHIDTTNIVEQYKAIKYFLKPLTAKEIKVLNKAKIAFTLDSSKKVETLSTPPITLAEYGNSVVKAFYKEFTNYNAFIRKGYNGQGVKIAVLDTGTDSTLIPYNYLKNCTTSPSIFGTHGLSTSSQIKSAMGYANGAELHIVKMIGTNASGIENNFATSFFLEALQYCIDSNVNIVTIQANVAETVLTNSMLEALANNGTLIFASSGNSTVQTTMSYPARHKDVIAINAYSVPWSGDRFPFKNSNLHNGKGIGFAAGGYSGAYMGTSTPNTGSGFIDTNSWGTSISAPLFAAIVACKWSEFGVTKIKGWQLINWLKNQSILKNQQSGNGVPQL